MLVRPMKAEFVSVNEILPCGWLALPMLVVSVNVPKPSTALLPVEVSVTPPGVKAPALKVKMVELKFRSATLLSMNSYPLAPVKVNVAAPVLLLRLMLSAPKSPVPPPRLELASESVLLPEMMVACAKEGASASPMVNAAPAMLDRR